MMVSTALPIPSGYASVSNCIPPANRQR